MYWKNLALKHCALKHLTKILTNDKYGCPLLWTFRSIRIWNCTWYYFDPQVALTLSYVPVSAWWYMIRVRGTATYVVVIVPVCKELLSSWYNITVSVYSCIFLCIVYVNCIVGAACVLVYLVYCSVCFASWWCISLTVCAFRAPLVYLAYCWCISRTIGVFRVPLPCHAYCWCISRIVGCISRTFGASCTIGVSRVPLVHFAYCWCISRIAGCISRTFGVSRTVGVSRVLLYFAYFCCVSRTVGVSRVFVGVSRVRKK